MFLTLTYDETKPDYHNELEYRDIQLFKKNLRSYANQKRNGKKRLEIFNVHEYGKNGKKHWHVLVFGIDFKDKEVQSYSNGNPLYKSKTLEKIWPHGHSSIGSVTEASAMYQAQYMEKDTKNGNNGKRKSKSNHSGLGKTYFMRHYRQLLRLGYLPFNGHKYKLPRYFEKLAHRHWCHYNDPSYFHDIIGRKKVYSLFKEGEANPEISQLYIDYDKRKKEAIRDRQEDWQMEMDRYIQTGLEPSFVQSLDNALYNLKNKTQQEKF
jgi:hypothetical protein